MVDERWLAHLSCLYSVYFPQKKPVNARLGVLTGFSIADGFYK